MKIINNNTNNNVVAQITNNDFFWGCYILNILVYHLINTERRKNKKIAYYSIK